MAVKKTQLYASHGRAATNFVEAWIPQNIRTIF